MKRLLIILALLSASASAQTVLRIQKFCEQGGFSTVTQGLNSVTKVQRSFPSCTVTVYLTGTTTLASIYSDNLAIPTPLANPFTANIDGSFGFYASPNSCYDVVTSGGISPNNFPTPFTYANVCVGSGGGGGGSVGPGTVNQIAKFVTPTNVGNSTGFDTGSGFVQWPNGLTVMGNAYGHLYPNSANGTTANYLACIDPTSTLVAEVTTCSTSTTKALGIVHAGTAGITGNAQVASLGFDSCVFDNQTVVGDYVGPSTSVGGQCTDLGGTRPASFQGVGRVTTLNNGAGTSAIIDLGPWDLFSPGSSGAGQCAFNNTNAYFTGGNLACDQFVTDDGAGNMTMKSLGLTDATQAGFSYMKQGTQPNATPLNTRMDTVPASVTTYTVIHPGVPCTVTGQTETVASTSTDSGGHTVVTMTCGTAGGGGVEAQVGGVDNANCTAGVCPLINFVAGPNVTITNTSGGNVQISANSSNTQITNPSNPTLVVGGTPGASTVTYVVQLCEDGPTCAFHTQTSTATATTANATLSSSPITISAYADTIYGYRCANIYRTVGGPSQGLVGACVWKTFVDNGVAATAGSPTNTNNTSLIPTMNPTSGGCNYPPGSPQGIDGLPCTPDATDWEGTETDGFASATDNWWTGVNVGSITATLNNGTVSLVDATGADQLKCYFHAVSGSTPWSYSTLVWYNVTTTGNVVAYAGLRESSTGKIVVIGAQIQTGGNSQRLIVSKWTNATTNSSFPVTSGVGFTSNPINFRVGLSGTTTTYLWSSDGIKYTTALSEAQNTFFTTGPNQFGICIDAASGTGAVEYDYVRNTH